MPRCGRRKARRCWWTSSGAARCCTGNIRDDRKIKIEKFMQLIEDDIQAGVLPKKNLNETKRYAEAFSGRPILPIIRKAGVPTTELVG